MMLLGIDNSVLNYAIPSLVRDLNPSATRILWIVDIYGFAMGGLLVFMGNLGDRIGRKRLLLVGAAAFGVASPLTASGRAQVRAGGRRGARPPGVAPGGRSGDRVPGGTGCRVEGTPVPDTGGVRHVGGARGGRQRRQGGGVKAAAPSGVGVAAVPPLRGVRALRLGLLGPDFGVERLQRAGAVEG